MMLNFVRKLARSGRNRYALFLLHGYYGNGKNIMELAEYFSRFLLEFSNDLCFIAPNAPEKIADNSYQWFPLDVEYITPESVAGAVARNHRTFRDFLEKQIRELSLIYKNIFLLGFSQGAMMALYTGIRLDQRIGGIVSFSGLQPDSLGSIESDARTGQRVLMLHSSCDSVVPYSCLAYSRNLLENFGSEVSVHICQNDVGHFIDQDCLEAAGNFIGKVIRDSEDNV
ncbi:MAG: hypothetical protein LBI29_00435 [Rickettsiales bacterium]|jgi:phospholipase/carboxylesterase|nr:hypothetical protein [Rickettsiales bacterium]